MKNSTTALCGVVLLGILLASCGGGGGGTPPPPAPTLTNVTPTQGPAAGGTALTLTGTNFVAGATVTVDGIAATSVVVVNATTITCVTPACPPGSADVVVTVPGGTATLPGAFAVNPPPTLAGVAPPVGSTFGGTLLSLTGLGFTANGAGTNTVTIGGVPATGVLPLGDTILHCVSPAGLHGPVSVVVTNANGSDTLSSAFAYFEPILAADGGGNPAPPWWDLHAIDPATGISYQIGPIGFGVTGMDFAGGVLYGTTAPGGLGGPRQLITINPVTGAGTLVGNTDDVLMVNHTIPDISFYLGMLYGTSATTNSLVTVGIATGTVTVAGPNPFAAPGGGFAVDVGSTSTYYMTFDTGPLCTVNPPTAFFAPGPALNGFVLPLGRICGATFHNGVLYAIDADGASGVPSPRHLVTVNTTTGLLTPVGPPLPPMINAIASRTR